MELIGKQIAIETILGQPPELHYPSWYAAQIEKLPPAPPEYLAEQAGILVTDTDTVSRQAAIDAIDEISNEVADGYGFDYAKWREYFAKMQSAQPTPDQNGDLWITVPDIDKATRIFVQEDKSKFCRIFYEEQPERIIHCKDCKYGILDSGFPHQRFCSFKGNEWNNDDHFCGHAKRREVTT